MSQLFTKLERAAWGGFIATQSRLFVRIEDDLRKRFVLTHAEFEVLLRLSFAPDCRMRIQDLAAKSLLSRSGTSRAVERLERAGHVVREGAEEDGRGAYALLTHGGKEHFGAAAIEHVRLVRQAFLSHFSNEELGVMAEFWSRLSADEKATSQPDDPKKVRAVSTALKQPDQPSATPPARDKKPNVASTTTADSRTQKAKSKPRK